MLSISAHKLHGPKGIGALYLRKGVDLEPMLHGGGQEKGRRSSTENLMGIVGFGVAVELARTEMAEDCSRLVAMRDRLHEGIMNLAPSAYLIGHRYLRLPGHLCVGFAGLEAQAMRLMLLLNQEGVAVSLGSACSSHHAGEPSQTLLALGMDPVSARGGMRITLGRQNTMQEVERFLEILPRCLEQLYPSNIPGRAPCTLSFKEK